MWEGVEEHREATAFSIGRVARQGRAVTNKGYLGPAVVHNTEQDRDPCSCAAGVLYGWKEAG